jgi:hypothetical protein
LKNAAARGELLDAGAVEADWSNTLRQVRAGMLAVPSRAGARPGASASGSSAKDLNSRVAQACTD